ncbi:hypothetical protein SAMN02745216_01522 [Desulfatibacillum alkenivorans DSM 16219]|jgi:hypothetical protein|uniref:Uncharacterized protein n=1 Tax=Desulfatibacillum alkenivorans DSM 16219 TaxID=1121393 RepID=A0A1M6ITG6_9BACT|nr:hypothetical protein [Desulfatibacillum alkenivorans]SHJ37707.1 hypothetical protein SAMN02745216_01522 [Desulfatibacillum alkenivorans DSM 16219]
MNDNIRLSGLDPLNVMKYAVEVLPATRWAVGVVGLAAAAAIIMALGKSPIFAVVAVTGIFVAMVAMFIFSQLLTITSTAVRPVAIVLMWFMSITFMAAVVVVFTSAFFNGPWPLRDSLFKSALAARAGDFGHTEAAEAIKGLSTEALKQIVFLNDAHHKVGYFRANSNMYVLSSIPAEVKELDAQNLIAWSRPLDEYGEIVSRNGLRLIFGEVHSPQEVMIDRSSPDFEALKSFEYRLNNQGLSIFHFMLDTVIKQLEKK